MHSFALQLLLLQKAWNGITPGVSTREDVVRKFGEPSKVVSASGRDILAYQKGKLISGTTQTQFRISPKDGVVERIDVFPQPHLTLADVAKAYGPACTPATPESAQAPCYLLRNEEKRKYLVYVRLGLAVFLTPDSDTVVTFAFLPEKP